jgi:hypothetical protein
MVLHGVPFQSLCTEMSPCVSQLLPFAPDAARSYQLLILNHIRPNDLHLLRGPVLPIRLHHAHLPYNAHALAHSPKDGMLPVQPRRRRQRDEELTSVGIGAAVRHAQYSRARVLQRGRDFVLELGAVDGSSAAAGTRGITALNHKVWDDPVEDEVVEVVALGEGGEVLACLRRVVTVELDGDSALRSILAANI